MGKKETEGVARYQLSREPGLDGEVMFRPIRALNRPDIVIANPYAISYAVQDAIAAAADMGITRTITFYEEDRDLASEEDLPIIQEREDELRKRLEVLPLDEPIEERLAVVQTRIEDLVAHNYVVRFAFEFGSKAATDIMDKYDPTDPRRMDIASFCGFFSVWEAMKAPRKGDQFFKHLNPYEPILNLIELGVDPQAIAPASPTS